MAIEKITAAVAGLVLFALWSLIWPRQNQERVSGLKRPPTLPSRVPLIGHLPEFMRDGSRFLVKAACYAGRDVPVKIRLPGFSSFVISGPESVQALFKNTRDLSTTSRSLTIMQNAFGCPPHLVDQFRPRPAVNGVQDPIEQAIHRGVQTGLTGPQLDVLANRFQAALLKNLHASQVDGTTIGDEWVHLCDLCNFIQEHVAESGIGMFFGPHMISLNPGIVQDFWKWDGYVRLMFMGMPRWCIPEAYRLRERMIQNIRRWQKHASQNFQGPEPGGDEWEPFYGSKLVRQRQALHKERGITDDTARAAENLALMWSVNANAVPAAMWYLIEVLRDDDLEKQTLYRVLASTPGKTQSSIMALDVAKLCSDPLLQSMYAETLRLRFAALIVREAAHGGFSFMGWSIKKDETLLVSSQTEAMNEDVWNAGHGAEAHPLDRFWAGRFVVDPADPRSGPLREPKATRAEAGAPSYSMDGLSASWIPYGGGKHLCPGRHFAKRWVIVTAAVFLTTFEIELDEKGHVESDTTQFGFGTLPAKGKVPCRIRRRRSA